jgi:hypothetical protein
VASAGAIAETARRGAVVELGAPRPHGAGFAGQRAALVAAALVGLVGLSEATGSLPYSVGRVVEWTVEPVVAYLLLAFPTGRLRSDTERLVVAAMLTVVVVLWLPTALLIHHYPVPAPWGSCSVKCPPNAFMVTSTQPGVISAVVNPVREALAQLLFLIVVAILVTRIRGASRLVRRTQVAVLNVLPALGMAGMRERLASVGGTVSFTSGPGAGTTLTARIPMHYDRRRGLRPSA